MLDNKQQVIEQAKNLALTISLFNSRYDKLIGEFNSKLSEVYLQLNSEQNKTKDALDFIAQNVAYQSNLDETKFELDIFTKNVNQSFSKFSELHDHPYSLDSHLHSDYSTVDHTHDYVSTIAYTDYANSTDSKLETLNEFTLESIQSICILVNDNYNSLLASIESTNSELDSISTKLATSIDDVEFKLDTFKSNTKNDIKDLSDIIDNLKKTIYKDLTKSLDDVSNKIDTEIDKVYDTIDYNIKSTNVSIKSLETSIDADIDDIEVSVDNINDALDAHTIALGLLKDGKSDIDHTHEDILTDIDELQEKHQSLEDSINDAFDKIKDKPEYSEILLKTDLDKLKQEIIDAVPVPKDGKDAEDWEFKPHPSRKGVLIFKKKSQKNWNYLDLNHIVPKMQEYQNQEGFSYIGGGGGASSGFPILWNNVLITTNSSINFTGTGITSVTDSNQIMTVQIDGGGVFRWASTNW